MAGRVNAADLSGGVDAAPVVGDGGGRMARTSPEALQTRQDICRAELLVSSAQSLTREEGADALRFRASVEGLSVHAVALAVLSAEPTDELLIAPAEVSPPPPARRRHLHALRSLADEHSTSFGAR